MDKKLLLAFCCFLFAGYVTNAQPHWQWGKRGGSGSSGLSGPGPDETVVDMATDTHGNLYVLSNVLQLGLNVDGHPRTGYGYQDIMVSSFKCDGTYRWSKIIGGNSTDVGIAIRTDTLGGVYICASTAFDVIGGGHIDADATVATTFKELLLVKYDTAGSYQWHRYPQSDTIGIYSVLNTRPVDMDVDGAGNSYTFCKLAPGEYAGGSYVAPSLGIYILKYDRTGAFISSTPIEITTTMGAEYSLKMKRDHGNGKYIISGVLNYASGTMTFGSTPISHPMMVGYFSSSGSLLWVKQDTDDILYGSSFGRAAVSAQHTIYLGGRASNTDVFNGYSIVDGGNTATPFVVAMDTAGSNIWAKNATVNAATECRHIALNGDELMIAGAYPGKVKWAGYTDSLNIAPGPGGYRIFVTRLDALTGTILGLDSIGSPSVVLNEMGAMTSDKYGNFYVGGDFGDQLWLPVPGDSLYTVGGGSDFFIAKYGTANCDTLHIPTLGTHPYPEAGVLRIYPNPVTNELTIENTGQECVIRMFNIMGQLVYSGTTSNNKQVVRMADFVTGTYLLQLTDCTGNRTTKTIVKQ